MKKQKALSIFITLALMMSLAACAQSNGEEPADTTLPADSESSTEGSASDEQADGDIKAIDYYIKLQDSPVDDGYDLSQEEMDQLEAIQFKEPEPDAPIATLKTSKGDIRIVFYPQYAPLAVENFLTHAQNGYYDGLTFHRVIEDFMIQGGDPKGNGTGGTSIYTNEDGDFIPFQNENNLYLCHFRGALSMANSGPDTNGSQFFIVQAPTIPFTEEVLLYNGLDEEQAAYYAVNQKELMTEMFGYPEDYADKYVQYGGYPALDGGYTVFGMVLEGMDIVDAIAAVETDAADMPTESVIIESIIVENA